MLDYCSQNFGYSTISLIYTGIIMLFVYANKKTLHKNEIVNYFLTDLCQGINFFMMILYSHIFLIIDILYCNYFRILFLFTSIHITITLLVYRKIIISNFQENENFEEILKQELKYKEDKLLRKIKKYLKEIKQLESKEKEMEIKKKEEKISNLIKNSFEININKIGESFDNMYI